GYFYILTLFMGLGAMTSGAMDVTNSNMAAPLLAKSISDWLFAIISAIAFHRAGNRQRTDHRFQRCGCARPDVEFHENRNERLRQSADR
ncbi:MAG: hypothetical protein RLO18_02650, partial [Gimesia chilikensis]